MNPAPTALPAIEPVTGADDARLDDYRHLKDRDLSRRGGRFVAESETVVRRLLGSGLTIHSVLLTPPRLAALAPELARVQTAAGAAAPTVYVAAQPVLDGIAGFHVHRGCLAIGERPARTAVPDTARMVLVLEDLVDVDNLGSLARSAAALGADALVLSPRCADPFYRKAIRVSMGAVLQLPVVRLGAWPEDLMALKRRHGFTLLGAVVDGDATPLASVKVPARLALLLGSEGPGLSAGARAACDRLITIPMAGGGGADSLNVATAGAIALYHLLHLAPGDRPRSP